MNSSKCATPTDSDCEGVDFAKFTPMYKDNTKTVQISKIINTLSSARPGEFISLHVDDNNFLNESVIEEPPQADEGFLCESTGRLINCRSPKQFVEEPTDNEISAQIEAAVPIKILASPVKKRLDKPTVNKSTKFANRRKPVHNAMSCEDIEYESIVLSETEEPPEKKSGIEIADVENPNDELMKKVAFLRACVNYMMLNLGKPAIEFGDNVTLSWMLDKY